jgi:hypothetical protein
MTRAVPFTQAFVKRAIKAARRQGLRVSRTTVEPDGAVTIHAVVQRDEPAGGAALAVTL